MEGTYKLGGVRAGVRTTSEAFGRWIDETLADHRMPRWKDPYYSVVVADQDGPGKRNFHVLYRGIVPLVRTLDLATLARSFLEEIESLTFRGRRDAVYLGASVIAGPTSEALIPATYTPSLGTQSRRCEQAGLTLPGSLWVAIDPDTGEAVPVRSELGIRDDAVERLTGMPPTDRYFVDRPLRLSTLCLIHDSPTNALEPVSRSLMLYRLAGVSENLPALGGRRTLEGLGRLVAGADCYGVAPMSTNHVLEAVAHVTSHGSELRALT